jgi:predicted N-acetyltransferase YhbS
MRPIVSTFRKVSTGSDQAQYDVTALSVTQRLSRILPRQDQCFLVAEVDGHLVGWLHTAMAEFVESPAFVVIGGLVVDSNHRREGIGRALIEHGEEWARKQGCSVVRLWSSSSRSASHQFYERLGYRNIKTQYSFLKALDATRDDDVGRFVPRV